MVKVENKETLRLLTKRFMKMNRARNIIAVIAIMLTSLLFTSLFVGSVSMILSKRATEIKQFMDSSHAIAQNLSEEDAERLQKTIEQDEDVERYGSGIFLGAGMDERFGFSVEVRYADENMAESFNCLPTTGRLPEKENEVALSSTILESLGVTPKIGEEVTLTWEVNPMLKQYKTDTFQICGFWQGDKAVLGQMVWVSEAYAKENRYPVTQEELENGIYNGGKEYSVWYKNLWNLEKKTENISSGDITDYTVDEVSQTLYYYVFNNGLYKRKLSDSKAERIYKMVENETNICQLSFDGKYLYMSNEQYSVYNL